MKQIVGDWKRGAVVFKDSKGYYVDQYDVKADVIRQKYLKNYKPRKDYPTRCLVGNRWKLCSTQKRSKKSSRKTRRK